jgi:hypothetical protein
LHLERTMLNATPFPSPVSADTAALPKSTPLDETQKTATASSQGQQHLRNAQILEASLQVSLKTGNDSLALLYRTAVDAINQALAPELGPDAIQNAMGQDHSAQATAGRIVGLSTAMFDAYAARYPDKELAEVAQDFVELIRGGFEQGYQEAEDILNSLGVLGADSPVAVGIAQTYELVHKGYDDWLQAKLSALRGDAAPSAPANASPAAPG